MKIKIDQADRLFSLYIRERDKWQCQRCKRIYYKGSQGLQCSHFWSRRHEATRFDELNAESLCYGCHALWEGDKQGEYRTLKLKQLGEQGYHDLERRAFGYCKKDRQLALLYVKQLIKKAGYDIR